MRRLLSVGVVVVLTALILSMTALAGNDPTKCVYHPEDCNKVVVQGAAAGKAVAATPAAGLPFTGADVTFLVAGGLLFGLVGFGIRRSGRNKSS